VSEIIMAPMPDSKITGVMESWMIGSSEPAGEASMGQSKIGDRPTGNIRLAPGRRCSAPRATHPR
jgi:hypothetical protein